MYFVFLIVLVVVGSCDFRVYCFFKCICIGIVVRCSRKEFNEVFVFILDDIIEL